ncbi:hypothetical protein MMC25_007175 [Agyrium rufum]|nr:hypothetical protein [Agyrium rufum]
MAASLLALSLSLHSLTTTDAASVIIQNKCTYPIYYAMVNGTGSTTSTGSISASPGSVTFPLASGTGNIVEVGKTPALSAPLTFDYSTSGTLLYYDLSSVRGNPFSPNLVTAVDVQTGGGSACQSVTCAGSTCYSSSATHVYACALGFVDFRVTTCA